MLTSLALVLLSTGVLAGDWIGTLVYPKRKNQPVSERSKQVSTFSRVAVVLSDLEDWVEVLHDEGTGPYVGRVLKKDVVRGDDAIPYFTKLTVADAKNAWAFSVRAKVWLDRGEIKSALADMNESLRLQPDSEGYILLGNIRYGLKDYDGAIADYTSALEIDPKSAAAYYTRGLAYHRKRDYDRAIADSNAALEIDSKYIAAYIVRGLAYADKKDYDLAIADYTAALEIDPKSAAAYNTRGLAYHSKRDYDRGIADFSAALEIEPKYAYALANRAMARIEQDNEPAALRDARAALEADPENHWVMSAMATLLSTVKDAGERNPTEALRLANKANEIVKELDWGPWAAIAAAHAAKGDFSAAIKAQTKAVELAAPFARDEMQRRLKLYESKQPLSFPTPVAQK